MKIGILGGSFNPPHKTHLKLGKILIKKRLVEKVIYVPNISNPYHNKTLVDPLKRYKMTKLLIKNQKGLEVSDIDILSNTKNYMYETMDKLQKIYKNDDLFLIIGSDNLFEVENWKESDYLLNNYKLIVIKRYGYRVKRLIEQNKFLNKYKKNIIIINLLFPSSISSTKVREKLKRRYLTKEVYNYIVINKLY